MNATFISSQSDTERVVIGQLGVLRGNLRMFGRSNPFLNVVIKDCGIGKCPSQIKDLK
ncbi:MAG: hypothetical protein JGK33_08930 [Microcoleus sp. PH2017_11_PCY_U_A]|uniref:hypothetical protein n=1 Tax=unclassified Microcoleus TaxID=2642155 RepID=UPI001DB2ED16|nr:MULTISPECIES: hypothetical protein [unclassified Microcoleus]MCC3459782.1 hypothetical protein [Microcoleus sp. PH2017_11_PCY_U_A]MCC3478215.1 hypothetical protein [Microcoleus sp. PH2017_12_PCY_D_A]